MQQPTVDQMVAPKPGLGDRRTYLGASEAGAICGVSPWRNAHDVWMSKVHDLEPRLTEPERIGTAVEPALLRLLMQDLALGPDQVSIGDTYQVADVLAPILAHPDAVIRPEPGATVIVEAKSTGLLEGWGDPDVPNEVPETVLAQVAVQFAAVPAAGVCLVPVLLGAHGLKYAVYEVWRNDRLVASVIARMVAFWELVQARKPPSDSIPSLESLKRVKRQPTRIQVTGLSALVRGYHSASERVRAAEADQRGLKARVLALLGDAEAAYDDGCSVSYLEIARKGYVVQPTTYRKLSYELSS